MIKIIHCADLHLESAFSGESIELAAKHRREMRESFDRLVNYINENSVDIVLIAGDLFDKNKVSAEAAEFVFSRISSSGARFFLSPGNHDYYSPDCVYGTYELPNNLHVFDDSVLDFKECEIKGERVRVYGYAFLSHSLETPPFRGKKPISDGAVNILLAHGNTYSSNLPDCPITLGDIRESGFDYIALGHIHNEHEIKREGNTYYGYSGSLEPRSIADTGERGAFLINAERREGRLFFEREFLPMAYRKYTKLRIDLSSLDEEKMRELIVSELSGKYSERDTLRVTLSGRIAQEVRVPTEIIESLLASSEYEIIDNTEKAALDSELEGDPTVKGALYRLLSDKLSSEDEKERRISALALRLALGALDGEEITDRLEEN
jgi:DNA repair exonuclease SbcCD nuclease subunit